MVRHTETAYKKLRSSRYALYAEYTKERAYAQQKKELQIKFRIAYLRRAAITATATAIIHQLLMKMRGR